MVNFSVFNELSLPIREMREFEIFFKVLHKLRDLGIEKIRMDRDFKAFSEILPNITFEQLLGQTTDRTQQRKLKSFIANSISVIEIPLIKKNEKEQAELLSNEYFYNSETNEGGLACSDIWNTIAVSFLSAEQWNKNTINLQKETIANGIINIAIRHTSKIEHLDSHQDFFRDIEEEKRLNITQDNFWKKKEEFFPKKILFCKEVKQQIKTVDKDVFYQAISMLRDIERDRKEIRDFNYSSESTSVNSNKKLKKTRYFTINDERVYFDNHLKFSSHRIYFLEKDSKIYIGYIGKHLPTKKY